MSDDDLRTGLAEEDEIRTLLGRPRRPRIPPFGMVAARAERTREIPSSLIALSLLAVLIVAAALVPHDAGPAAVSASPGGPITPSPTSTVSCDSPGSLELARHQSSPSLITSVSSVELSDRQTNQMRWTLRFLSRSDTAAATISAQVEIRSGDNFLNVLGYQLVEPESRALGKTESVTVAPCRAASIVVRTAGPVLDGIWPYTVSIDKVGVPEGATVSETLEVTLSCSNTGWTCIPAAAGATQPPGPTPNMAVLKPAFGVIYSGKWGKFTPGSAPQIRREGETSAVGELASSFFEQPRTVLARGGRRAVYFAQPQGEPWGIYLLDGAGPTEQRRLLALPGEIPRNVVWSSDATAIAFTAVDEGGNQGVPSKYSALRTLDLASGKVTEVARVTGGDEYGAVAYTAGGILAATISPNGAPATSYVVFDPSAGRLVTAMPQDQFSTFGMHASPDARTSAGMDCEGGGTGPCSVLTWPIQNFAARVKQSLPSGLSASIIGWVARTDQIALEVTDVATTPNERGPNPRIELWSASTGQLTTLYRIGADESPSSQPFLRADGSAIILPEYVRARVIDIATGASSFLPVPPPTGPYDYALPSGSILLDPP